MVLFFLFHENALFLEVKLITVIFVFEWVPRLTHIQEYRRKSGTSTHLWRAQFLKICKSLFFYGSGLGMGDYYWYNCELVVVQTASQYWSILQEYTTKYLQYVFCKNFFCNIHKNNIIRKWIPGFNFLLSLRMKGSLLTLQCSWTRRSPPRTALSRAPFPPWWPSTIRAFSLSSKE